MKQSFADILSARQAEIQAKADQKVPSWKGKGLEYPGSLCLEQCSGQEAALRKAEAICPQGCRAADLTGGLGVDSWAFSLRAEKVFYNERNPELRGCVERNFGKLGITNTEFHSMDVSACTQDWVEALKLFCPDIIYLDPARRDGTGRKVFRPEDCQPDIVGLLPVLKGLSKRLAVKLSPMADISMLCGLFKPHLTEIQVVGVGSEVKELLCLLNWDSDCNEPLVRAVDGRFTFEFRLKDEQEAQALFATGFGEYLLEPEAVLLKAGAFKLLSRRCGIFKLAPSTQLYTSGELVPMMKGFRIMEVLDFSGKSVRELGRRFPHADVSARNVPLKSDELRAKMNISDGPSGGIHIFACETVFGRKLIVTASVR